MVPLAAPGLYFVSVRENPSAETPFQTVRVYLKRLPSGVYRVTVLSPFLPRPVFRMYPAGTSEADAVARAVGRALSIRVNAEQRDQRNNAEAEHKVHGLAFEIADSLGPNDTAPDASSKSRRPLVELVEVKPQAMHMPTNDKHPDQDELPTPNACPQLTQHRRPPLRLRVTWQGLL